MDLGKEELFRKFLMFFPANKLKSSLVSNHGAILLKIHTTVFAFMIMLYSPVVLASACAPDTGEWSEFKQAPSDFELSGLSNLHFDQAKIYSGSRGIISAPTNTSLIEGTYSLKVLRSENILKLKFFKGKKKRAIFFLKIPKEWEFFQSQTDELRTSSQENLQMLKEVRLEGSFKTAGMFANKKNRPNHYRLIYQGSGGRCFEPLDFKRWILKIYGPDPENSSSQDLTLLYWFQGFLKH